MSNVLLHFNIEKTLIRDGMIFLIGWAHYEIDVIRNIRLFIEDETGLTQVVEAELGYVRSDVAARFPGANSAKNAGFIAYGGWGASSLKTAYLEFLTADASVGTVVLYPDVPFTSSLRVAVRRSRMLLSKGAQAIQGYGVLGAIEKVRTYVHRRPKADAAGLSAAIASTQGRGVVWIVDHDMGGGANQYRQQYVETCLADGNVVVVLGFQVSSLSYYVQFHLNERAYRYALNSLDDAYQVARQLSLFRIVYNCAVSFRDPLQVCKLMVTLKAEFNCKLVFLVHDFFSICPSHVLLNSKTTYCELPNRITCDGCLRDHSSGFVSMANVRGIALWREAWGALIEVADDVQVFSPSSLQLLTKAYPRLSRAYWRLIPHRLPFVLPALTQLKGNSLHIGVVGTLGLHKGANIVAALAQEIARVDMQIPITVFGTIQTSEPSPGVLVTGAYQTEDLPSMIAASGANVFLFASIWPETFSYVAHELCAMELPVVCFDMGAQADLIKTYKKGKVLVQMESKKLLNELLLFWEVSYASKAKTI